MDEFMEAVRKIMAEDRKNIVLKKDIEELYVWEIADKWIDMNMKNQSDFEQKLNALGNILNCKDFETAIKTSRLAYNENNNEKAKETAELIKRIKQTDEYAENSKISRYMLLDKYEDPNTYKTDSFIVHTNIMIRLYKYLEEKLCKVKEEKYGK